MTSPEDGFRWRVEEEMGLLGASRQAQEPVQRRETLRLHGRTVLSLLESHHASFFPSSLRGSLGGVPAARPSNKDPALNTHSGPTFPHRL